MQAKETPSLPQHSINTVRKPSNEQRTIGVEHLACKANARRLLRVLLTKGQAQRIHAT